MGFPMDLKQLRNALGLAQLEMANLLGVNRAQLSMAESGKRELPINAYNRVMKINAVLQNSEAPVELPAVTENKKIILEELLAEARWEEKKLILQLNEIKMRSSANQILNTLLEKMDQLDDPNYDEVVDQRWKKDMISSQKNSKHKQKFNLEIQLESDVVSCRAKIEKLEKMLEG